jgi:hypothetical protein
MVWFIYNSFDDRGLDSRSERFHFFRSLLSAKV